MVAGIIAPASLGDPVGDSAAPFVRLAQSREELYDIPVSRLGEED